MRWHVSHHPTAVLFAVATGSGKLLGPQLAALWENKEAECGFVPLSQPKSWTHAHGEAHGHANDWALLARLEVATGVAIGIATATASHDVAVAAAA